MPARLIATAINPASTGPRISMYSLMLNIGSPMSSCCAYHTADWAASSGRRRTSRSMTDQPAFAWRRHDAASCRMTVPNGRARFG